MPPVAIGFIIWCVEQGLMMLLKRREEIHAADLRDAPLTKAAMDWKANAIATGTGCDLRVREGAAPIDLSGGGPGA